MIHSSQITKTSKLEGKIDSGQITKAVELRLAQQNSLWFSGPTRPGTVTCCSPEGQVRKGGARPLGRPAAPWALGWGRWDVQGWRARKTSPCLSISSAPCPRLQPERPPSCSSAAGLGPGSDLCMYRCQHLPLRHHLTWPPEPQPPAVPRHCPVCCSPTPHHPWVSHWHHGRDLSVWGRTAHGLRPRAAGMELPCPVPSHSGPLKICRA